MQAPSICAMSGTSTRRSACRAGATSRSSTAGRRVSRPGAYATDEDAPGASRAGDDERGEFMRGVYNRATAVGRDTVLTR